MESTINKTDEKYLNASVKSINAALNALNKLYANNPNNIVGSSIVILELELKHLATL